MLLLAVNTLPEAPNWSYEVKFDGYRALGIKSVGRVDLRSRNNKDFGTRYPSISQALAALPDDTVVDGEVVAFDRTGKPSFSALQNYEASHTHVFYYLFDVLVLTGRDVMSRPLAERRELLHGKVLPNLKDPIRESIQLTGSLIDVTEAVRELGLEGLVAKNLNSFYEPGRRSGSWRKMRLNKGQEFVIGGYTIAPRSFDAVVFGYHKAGELLYAGRTRNGFTPRLRQQLYNRFGELEIADCPFTNLPEQNPGRWGVGLTGEKMKQCRWLRPEVVARIEFVEWTADNHLRHARFVATREDVLAADVTREPDPK